MSRGRRTAAHGAQRRAGTLDGARAAIVRAQLVEVLGVERVRALGAASSGLALAARLADALGVASASSVATVADRVAEVCDDNRTDARGLTEEEVVCGHCGAAWEWGHRCAR